MSVLQMPAMSFISINGACLQLNIANLSEGTSGLYVQYGPEQSIFNNPDNIMVIAGEDTFTLSEGDSISNAEIIPFGTFEGAVEDENIIKVLITDDASIRAGIITLDVAGLVPPLHFRVKAISETFVNIDSSWSPTLSLDASYFTPVTATAAAVSAAVILITLPTEEDAVYDIQRRQVGTEIWADIASDVIASYEDDIRNDNTLLPNVHYEYRVRRNGGPWGLADIAWLTHTRPFKVISEVCLTDASNTGEENNRKRLVITDFYNRYSVITEILPTTL